MAVLRQPLTCTNCGHKNYFISNPLSKWQKDNLWCGDTGGHYPTICKNCKKGIYKGVLLDGALTEEKVSNFFSRADRTSIEELEKIFKRQGTEKYLIEDKTYHYFLNQENSYTTDKEKALQFHNEGVAVTYAIKNRIINYTITKL